MATNLIQNNHILRAIIYGATIVLTITSIVTGELMPDAAIAEASFKVAQYLGGLSGITALANLSVNKQPVEKP